MSKEELDLQSGKISLKEFIEKYVLVNGKPLELRDRDLHYIKTLEDGK